MAEVDFAFAHDSSGPRRWGPMLAEMGASILHPERLAVVSDHYVPAADADSAAILKLTRDFARENSIDSFFDGVGICHTVLPEHGLIRPGAFIAGGDSHTPTAGAFGAFATGFGATDMAAIVATGETWIQVPSTLRVEFDGVLARGITAKDLMLMLIHELGMDNAFRVIEYGGSAVESMSMGERMVLCNMAAELGADSGVIAADQTTFEYLAATGRPIESPAAVLELASDSGAGFESLRRFDVADIAPYIAAPHSPENSRPVSKLGDLRMAAEILRHRKVSPGVRLIVAPASTNTTRLAAEEGTLGVLLDAGAILQASGCGACAGYGGGVLAQGDICISTTNRNFRGRMGDRGSFVYLGSPYSVAAAAVAGHIVDPRPLLSVARAA